MKPIVLTLVLLAAAPVLSAHEPSKHAAPAATAAPAADAALAAPRAVADRFSAALKGGDFDTVREVLDERVVILESGGAERSREEYLGHHAIADAAFLSGATINVTQRTGGVSGDLAWLGTESEITPPQGSDAKPLLSTETMVLKRDGGAWKIVHIHWSSRPKKAAAK